MKLTLQLWACHASMTDLGLLCPGGAAQSCVVQLFLLRFQFLLKPSRHALLNHSRATTTGPHINIPAMIFTDADGKTFKSPERGEGVPSPEQVSRH